MLFLCVPLVLVLATDAVATCVNGPVFFGRSVVGTCDQDADIKAGCIKRVARFTNTTDSPIAVSGMSISGVVGASFGLDTDRPSSHPCLTLPNDLLPAGQTCTVPVLGGATQLGRHVGALNILNVNDLVFAIPLHVTGVTPTV